MLYTGPEVLSYGQLPKSVGGYLSRETPGMQNVDFVETANQ